MSNNHGNDPASFIEKDPKCVCHKPKTLTPSDIAAAIMRRTPSLSQREAINILASVLQEIANALMYKEKIVKLHEFGTFYVCEKKARKRRNPLTGKNSMDPRKSLKFRPSLRLKQKVEKTDAWRRCPRA
ncbi:MAG: HU family DNA-binding protein [Methylocystis sp.]